MELFVSNKYICFISLTFLVCLTKPTLSCVTFIQISAASTSINPNNELSYVSLNECMKTCKNENRCQAIFWDRVSERCKIYYSKIISYEPALVTSNLFLITYSSLFCSAKAGCSKWNEWRSRTDASSYKNLKLQQHIDASNSLDTCAVKAARLPRKEFLYDLASKKCYIYFENGYAGMYSFSDLTKHYPQKTLSACISNDPNINPNPLPTVTTTTTTTTTSTTTTTKKARINVLTTTKIALSTTIHVRKTPAIVSKSSPNTTEMNDNITVNTVINSNVTPRKEKTSLKENSEGKKSGPKAQASTRNWNRSLLKIQPVYIVLAGLGFGCVALTLVAIVALCQGKMGGKGDGSYSGSVNDGGSDIGQNYQHDEEVDKVRNEYTNSDENVPE